MTKTANTQSGKRSTNTNAMPAGYQQPSNGNVSQNHVEREKAARAANKVQGGQTHSVLRKPW